MKTIILTESQVKNVIGKVLSERNIQPTNVNEPQMKPIKQFNINNSFKSGQYKLTDTSLIDAAIAEINAIVAKTPNTKYDVVTTSSESKVPNSGVGLKPGDLSLKRGQEVEKYIKSKLGDNISLKNNNLGIQGPEWVPSKGKDNPEYTKYQYTTISLVISAGQKPTSPKDVCNWSYKAPGEQGDPSKNYITANEVVEGKGNLTITTGSIPDRMVIVNTQNQIVKDSGYVATKAHKYTDFKYVPYYVAQLTRLNGTPSVSGKNLITIEATNYDSLMRQLLVDPKVIPNSNYLYSLGEEVSLGVSQLKKMVESGTSTFVLYSVKIGSSTLPFDVNTGDNKVMVFSPIGQTGYEIKGNC
jgi:hypothetical protein